jgi:predicted Rossmann fold flavoprotein
MAAGSTDVAIIGGGAAGLMCAITAGRRKRRVVVIEHNAQVGRKILISGGGRCNFTNLHTQPGDFLSANPHFAKSALARYTPQDFLELVNRHRIAWHEKTAGQLFCDGSAREIVEMLLSECASAGVRVEAACKVHGITGSFDIETSAGLVHADSLVIATGGLSIPKIGATSFGYDIARQYGLNVIGCRPALVPWTFAREDRERYSDLAGVAAEARVCAGAQAFRDRLLFTHRGLSGPAVLQASSYWRPGEPVAIDLAPGIDAAACLRELRGSGSRLEARTWAAGFLAKRLADRWLEPIVSPKPAAGLSDREMEAIAERLHAWRFCPAGTEGYEKAEVTGGGVDTSELSSKTMEARKVPRLYFIGEVVDVTGHLGGYNFQWAWASGYAAGLVV